MRSGPSPHSSARDQHVQHVRLISFSHIFSHCDQYHDNSYYVAIQIGNGIERRLKFSPEQSIFANV